jgi:hypothetical protein
MGRMSTITKRQPDPRSPLTQRLDLSCGHTVYRSAQNPPKRRVLCEICHPKRPATYRSPWVKERKRTYDAVRQERGNRAMRRIIRRSNYGLG